MKNILATVFLACLFAACGGGSGSAPETPPPPPPPVSVTASAAADQVLAGGAAVALTASASNGAAISWQLAAGAPGSLSATSGNSVSYTPPASGVGANTDVVVTASAGGGSKALTLTIYPDPGAPGTYPVAGSAGQQGFDDGKGAAASFTSIQSIVADKAGGYYVYDGNWQRLTIRKINAAGDVSTIYSNSASYNDFPHSQYSRLAIASDGALYVMTHLNSGHQLLRIGPAGTASVALSGAALDMVFNIQKAPNGAVYLFKPTAVLKLAADGALSTVAGDPAAAPSGSAKPADGTGSAARFNFITAAGADDEGNLLIKDSIFFRRMSAAGVVTTVDLPFPEERSVLGLLAAPDGAFYMLAPPDAAGRTLYRISASNDVSVVFNTDNASLPRTVGGPLYMALGSDLRLMLAYTGEILHIGADGKAQSFAGLQEGSGLALDGPPTQARFAQPNAIAADRQGNLFVLDHPGTAYADCLCVIGTRGSTLRKISASGQVTTLGAGEDNGTPNGMAVDRAGTVYFSDIQQFGPRGSNSGSAVYKITADGKFSVLAGCPPSRSCTLSPVDGSATEARFAAARLLGVDADGNLYAEDTKNGSTIIRKISADGSTTTIAALPPGIGVAPDGSRYTTRRTDPNGWTNVWDVVRTAANGSETVVASGLKGRVSLAPAGPYTVGVIAGETILKLVVPH
ncbi:hypothetical protein [Pseudoduganella rhizocola]|uniref:hypothetical protein n=1 Tax=Pseudoduganella rhizocola TaxID=3382643 RepID=UPI0038B68A30